MTLYEMILECQGRGKMTDTQAVYLRRSIHVFIDAIGTKSLAAAELPRWMEEHCKPCDQKDCLVKGHLEIQIGGMK